ncbi:MAG: integrating conjugative element protein [Chromatiaceae bacterium]|nr:integrating conjugative element protein [Chromatiaceae bacterium]MCP5435970.1 integrating conjugative element protein [Chromatiaceae bacterium]
MRRLTATLFLCAVLPAFAATPLKVLYDSGDTLPLAPLLEASGFVEEPDNADLPPIAPPMEAVLQQQVTVRSPSLIPGAQPRIQVGAAGAHLPRPIFLVGADELSLRWLTKHRIRLSTLGAAGLVVEADGVTDVLKVKRVAGDLPLAAGSGEMLAEQFGLRHYPVLIGPEWIEQ